MGAFRAAEDRVRTRYPWLNAEALITLYPHEDSAVLLDACLVATREGLAGIDLIPLPYNDEAACGPLRECAARAVDGGLGVTVHAGEFSWASLDCALRIPGVTRIGHAVQIVTDPRLLERLARTGMTVECSLTSNVVLGAVRSYEEHPIRRLVDHGISVTLSTDNLFALARRSRRSTRWQRPWDSPRPSCSSSRSAVSRHRSPLPTAAPRCSVASSIRGA